MSDQTSAARAPKVVTLNSVALPATEAVEAPGKPQTPAERMVLARYDQIVERLRQVTAETGPDLMVTVPDREVSRLQSELARRAAAERRLEAGGLEVQFGTGLGGGDWFGWARSLLDWVDRKNAHELVRPKTVATTAISETARIAMTADWGTGLYGAPRIAKQIQRMAPFDLLLHLGDVYYSGTPEEVQERFLDLWTRSAGKLSRALNSNHEMYSGGFGYFDLALPALQQDASYFALENKHWLLVGLDTAYVDHDLDIEQVAWLNLVVDQVRQTNGGAAKKLVLFSHHQLFSRLDGQGPKLEQALRHMLGTRAITAWYWGHEHQCVIYEPHPTSGLRGRCLGNGGIPERRSREVRQAPVERSEGVVTWNRLAPTKDSPACLVLDGPNPDIRGEEQKFAPHGFMTLELAGPTLTERVFATDGTEVLSNVIS
jgi:hypothetical protein